MIVWLYCICKDEAPLLPYFIRHYQTWIDLMIFYDDQSTDGTREIIQKCHKAVLRDWKGTHALVDDEFTAFANEQWKEARGYADWVCWVDADEFLYHPHIIDVLYRYLKEGVNIPQIAGYTMVSDHFPTTKGQIYDEVKTGFRDGVWDKKVLFRENMIWNVGRHSIHHPRLKIRSSETAEIKLLHFRCLGMEYLEARHKRNWDRVPERCRALNLGTNCQPGHEGHHGIQWFRDIDRSKLENVI